MPYNARFGVNANSGFLEYTSITGPQWAALFCCVPIISAFAYFLAGSPFLIAGILAAFIAQSFFFLHYKSALYVLVALIPFDPTFLGIGFYYEWSLPRKDLFPLFPFLLAIASAGLLAARLTKAVNGLSADYLQYVALVFILWVALSLQWSPNTHHGALEFSIVVWNCVLYIFVVQAIDTPMLLRRICWAWVVMGLLVGIANVLVRYLPDMDIYYPVLGDNIKLEFHIRGMDVNPRSRTISNDNVTAMTTNLFLSVAVGLFLFEGKRINQIFLLLAIAIMIFGQLLNMSKGGTLGLLVMASYFLLVFKVFRKNLFLSAYVFVLGFTSLFILHIVYLASERGPRLIETSSGESYSLITRLRLWDFGWDNLLQSGFFCGLGAGGFTNLNEAPHAHSLILSVLFDFGAIGLLLLLGVAAILITRVMTKIARQDSFSEIMFLATSGGFVSLGVQGLFDASYTLSVFYLFLGLSTSAYFFAEGAYSERRLRIGVGGRALQ